MPMFAGIDQDQFNEIFGISPSVASANPRRWGRSTLAL
jgi:hypothetical protein